MITQALHFRYLTSDKLTLKLHVSHVDQRLHGAGKVSCCAKARASRMKVGQTYERNSSYHVPGRTAVHPEILMTPLGEETLRPAY